MMHWNEQIFRYCERGVNSSLLAEPLNGVSNGAFLFVALLAAVHLGRMQFRHETGGSSAFAVLVCLIALTSAIGLGSLVFHIFATRLSQLADFAPIGAFVVVYFGYALKVMLGLRARAVWPCVGLLGIGMVVAGLLCQPSDATLSAAVALPSVCLNGSVAYVPALIALITVIYLLHRRKHPAVLLLLAASALFVVALAFRSLDLVACPLLRLGPLALTTHTLWHLTNAAVIYLLLRAAIAFAPDPVR